MTTVQRVAQVFGWIFVLIALWGFFISRGSMESDPAMAPAILGIFPVNLIHNLVHLALGIWGIVAARGFRSARSYALIAGLLYALLAGLGLIAPEGFGLVPIGGNDVWLHVGLAVVLLGAAFMAASPGDAPGAAVRGTNPEASPPSTDPDDPHRRP